MSDPQDEELTAFEGSLADLVPIRGLDRDRLMYEAGRRVGLCERRRGLVWPAVAASLAMLALGRAVALSRRPIERLVERAAVSPNPIPASDPVVVLARREPARPTTDGGDILARRLALKAIRDVLEMRLEPDPPLLSAAYFGPMDAGAAETLSPLHGRDGDLRSIPGGPL